MEDMIIPVPRQRKPAITEIKIFSLLKPLIAYLILLLEFLLVPTGRGEVMSLISDTDTRGDLKSTLHLFLEEVLSLIDPFS